MKKNLFFIQKKDEFLGNALVWWAQNSDGYTPRIDLAEMYTREEAEEILRLAASEADTLRERARDDLSRSVQRREQQAVARIAQAEAEATQQVRDMAIDIAISATDRVLSDELRGTAGKKIIDSAIQDLPKRVN